jgi:uncharacterized membrane protein
MTVTYTRIAKITALIALLAIVTGCCIAPFGHGHYRGGYSQGAYGR